MVEWNGATTMDYSTLGPYNNRVQMDLAYGAKEVMDTAVLGDSIDADTTGWWPTACALSAQRMRNLYNAGVGGDTTTMALARISSVINNTPKVCIIGGGVTNDIAQGISLSTTQTNITAMVTQLRSAGIVPLFRNCPPRGAGAAPYNTDPLAIAAVNTYNSWLSNYAKLEGIELFDIYAPLVNTSTSLIEASKSDDGIHPNAVGSLAVARHFRDNLPRVFVDAPPFKLVTKNTESRVKNPLFIANSGGMASDWANGTGFTTKDVTSKAPFGNWQHLARTDGAWALTTQQPPITSGSLVTIGFRISVVTGTAIVSYRIKDAANTALGSWVSNSVRVPVTKDEDFVYIIKFIAPAGSASVEIWIENQRDGLGPAVDFSIAQFTVKAE